jgi:hypothetical protein
VYVLLACGQSSKNKTATDIPVVDSSFTAFMTNFETATLPLKVDSIRLSPIDKSRFIKDYFLRNFLANDKTSNIEGYMTEYTNAMQYESPWNFAWYDSQFSINEVVTAIIYHTYKQISASNGGTYQSMLATFGKDGKMIQCVEIGEQSIYQATNLIANEAEDYSTFSSVFATVKTIYTINRDLRIHILQTKEETYFQEIQDTNDSTLLVKNQDSTFTKQIKTPEVIKKVYRILKNGKISQ